MNDEGEAAISGSQGVQVGSGNIQSNTWLLKPAADLGPLSALSLSASVARIRQMPYEDVVDLFANALPGDVAEVLQALLAVDEALMVAVLAEFRPNRVMELIASVPATYSSWLSSLPIAAAAIEIRASMIGWDRDGNAGRLERHEAMYSRKYERGSICWSAESGAQSIRRDFMECYQPTELGCPVNEEEAGYQRFVNGCIVRSKFGNFSVSGEIYLKFDSAVAGDVIGGREDFPDYCSQRFQYGLIYSSRHGAFFVPSALAAAEVGPVVPIEDHTEDASLYGTTGIGQRFQGDSGEEVQIYSFDGPSGKEIYRLTGRRLFHYRGLGGVESWLGFPTSEPHRVRDKSWLQRFEGGAIFDRDGQGSVTVSNATLELIHESEPGGGTKLGWPVFEEESIGSRGRSDRIQFFENGIVTMRGSKREIWLRPDSGKS